MKHAAWMIGLLMACGVVQAQPEAKAPAPKTSEQWPLVWLDEDNDCQHTDVEVLITHAVNLLTWADPEACTLSDGSWLSWASGRQLNLSGIWVVPVVTPTNAVNSGATDWTREQQIDFINDQDNLIPMDPFAAAKRGFAGPDEWLPEVRFQCEYAQRWTVVKARYGLTFTDPEREALRAVLATCQAE